MIYIRNLIVFCFIITLASCSGLLKTAKKVEDKVVLMTTSKGTIVIDLYNETPKHKANFLKLVDSSFYDDLLFHRVINGFMAQGGDPNSKNAGPGVSLGNGGPGYTIPAEFDTSFFHKKGALSAARLGDGANPKKASSGCQFYLVQGKVYSVAQIKNMETNMKRTNPEFKFTTKQIEAYTTIGGTPFLDGGYTVFGEIIYGLDVVDKIAAVETLRGDRPKEDVWMKAKTINRGDLSKEGIVLK